MTQRQRRTGRGVFLAVVVGFDDVEVPAGQGRRGFTQETCEHGHAQAEIGGAKDGDALGRLREAIFQRVGKPGRAGDQRRAAFLAMIERAPRGLPVR